MKNLLILIITLMTKSLYGQPMGDINKIDAFVKKVILDKSFQIEKIGDFVSINKDTLSSKKKELYQVLSLNVDEIHQLLNKCTSGYKIVQHNSVEKKLLDEFKLEYSDYNSVYYIICNKQIITPIVIRNNQIISFFTTLKKLKSQKFKPWLLN